MRTQVISLNVGQPQVLEWRGKSVKTSMLRTPVPGPLRVHLDRIEGDKFEEPHFHGVADSVLYAFGMSSALEVMRLLGQKQYPPGALGENVTVVDLDERAVSVGDLFRIGEVLALATYPRTPCGKVNIRMQHEHGQKLMQQSGRSGVYFRILESGQVNLSDSFERVSRAKIEFSIAEVYRKIVNNETWSAAELDRVYANGCFPAKFFKRLNLPAQRS